MKGILVSPVVSKPALSGNSSRVGQIVGALHSLGVELEFVLCPIVAISDRRNGDQMNRSFPGKYHELNGGRLIRGVFNQRLLNIAKKRFKAGRFHRVEDFMFEDGYVTPSVQWEFEGLVRKFNPDFVIVEYAILSKLVARLPVPIIRIVDTHDMFSERNARIRATGGTGTWFSLSKTQEKRLLERFDHVIAIQRNEGSSFAKLLDLEKSKVCVLSILDPPRRDRYSFAVPQSIGFIGSNNRHNFEGLEQFLEMHWTAIRAEVKGARLLIAGADYPKLHHWKQSGVEFLGRVESLETFYDDCSFIVNPCISGTGLKIKSVEALSFGKPLLTTPEGAEGIEDSLNQGSLVDDLKSESFRKHCIALLQDETRRTMLGESAIEYIRIQYERSLALLEEITSARGR